VIARLSKAGILRLRVAPSSPMGGRPTRQWQVNPPLRLDADSWRKPPKPPKPRKSETSRSSETSETSKTTDDPD